MYEVAALRYGTRRTRKSECYHRWSSYGEPDAEIGMDYFFWVLRNGDSTIVVDTGFHPDSGARRGRTCLCPPDEALRRIGVEPETRVAMVVLTHFHYDHTGNLECVPGCRAGRPARRARVLVGSQRRDTSNSPPRSSRRRSTGSADRRPRVLRGDASVAPGIRGVCVGGHSPGQTVLVVETTAARPSSPPTPSTTTRSSSSSVRSRSTHDFARCARATPPCASWHAGGARRFSPATTPEVMIRSPCFADGLGVRVA